MIESSSGHPGDRPASISDKGFAPDVSIAENLRRIRQAGFTHLHFSHKWTKREALTSGEEAEWLRALAENGINVLDVHGCHPKRAHLWSPNQADQDLAKELLLHRLELTARLGGNAMVYHVPWEGEIEDRQIDDLLEELRRVEDRARELGVSIALENHYRAENDRRTLSAAFEAFAVDFVGFTFDPGHALISGNSEWLMANCADRLQILHLNDNDATRDHHWIPFDPAGQGDWAAIKTFIETSAYDKPWQLEVSWSPSRHGRHEAFLAEARKAVDRLQEMNT